MDSRKKRRSALERASDPTTSSEAVPPEPNGAASSYEEDTALLLAMGCDPTDWTEDAIRALKEGAAGSAAASAFPVAPDWLPPDDPEGMRAVLERARELAKHRGYDEDTELLVSTGCDPTDWTEDAIRAVQDEWLVRRKGRGGM